MDKSTTLVWASLLSMSASCGGGGGIPTEEASQAAQTYAQIAYQGYRDALTEAQLLNNALTTLVSTPSEQTHAAAKEAWLAAREPYLQTEVFRFYDGPIDNPADGPEGSLNAWPMDEAYVDYTRDDASAGIINDLAVPIETDTLRGKNEDGGEENIAVGYHPIEFLLWGQDGLDSSDGLPGQRPFTDFVADAGGTADNQSRRSEYLTLLSEILLADLQTLVDAWAPNTADNYRAAFEGDPALALERMLTGMIVLSGVEVAGERLQVALDNGDQEDEHSCFSDNTHRDMVQDVRGVQNVWLGSYTALTSVDSVAGTGVRDVVAALDPQLAQDITDQIAISVMLAQQLRPTDADPPFDVLISLGNIEGNNKVQALIDSLRVQETLLSDAFVAFGLAVPQPE